MIRLPATLLAIFLAQLAPGPQTVPYYIADGKGVAGYEPADRDPRRPGGGGMVARKRWQSEIHKSR
jgi:hypothetical protein